MSRRTFLPYAAGLALAVTLTGCAAESAAPEPTTPVSTASAPSSSVATSVTAAPAASPTSAAPDFPEGLPAAAKKHTKDGAVAFVKYFIDQLNRAWRSPDPRRIKQLCAETSKSCQSFIETAEHLRRQGHRYDSDPVRVDHAAAFGEAEGLMRVELFGGQTGARVVDGAGSIVEEEATSSTQNMFYLDWSSSGWTVAAIKDVK